MCVLCARHSNNMAWIIIVNNHYITITITIIIIIGIGFCNGYKMVGSSGQLYHICYLQIHTTSFHSLFQSNTLSVSQVATLNELITRS